MISRDLISNQFMDLWVEQQPEHRWKVQVPFMMGGYGDMIVVLIVLEPGQELPSHTDDCSELVVILGGQIEATVDGEHEKLVTGQLLAIPLGAAHSFRNSAPGRARLLSLLPTKTLTTTFNDVVSPLGQRVMQFGGQPPA